MTFHLHLLVAVLVAAVLSALLPVAVDGAEAAAASTSGSVHVSAGPRIWRPLTPTTKPAAAATESTTTNNNNDDGGDHACPFFLWDIPSLIQYKLCAHLLRRNVYEARGGKKMVRIRPGSALEWLYPLSQHAPDRCALCGHTFEDHLGRWWEKKGQVGTAFDRVLDETYDEGVSVVYLDGASNSGGNDVESLKRPHYRVFSFHRRYVEDIPKDEPESSSLADRKRSGKGERIKRMLDDDDSVDEYEKYTRGPVPYRIPKFEAKGIGSLWKALVLLLGRSMALDEIDTLIELETKENRLLERRASMF